MAVDDETDELASEVRAVAALFARRLRAEATTGGLTISQEVVVSALAQSDGLTSAELARLENVRPQAMTPTLAALVAEGYVYGAVDPNDKRRTIVTLTEPGRAALTQARALKQQWLVSLLDETFTAEERGELRRGLDLLRRLGSSRKSGS
jgi:DNA-binding MarR family transcriptional regulator